MMGKRTVRDVLQGALCLYMLSHVPGSMADTIWRAVNVDRNKIVPDFSTVTSEAPSLRLCGTICDQSSTCLSWYYENQVCSLTDLMVSPLHQATTDDRVKFYTRMEKDFAVGSTVTASSVQFNTAYASNLAKGIYNKIYLSTCYGAQNHTMDPWVLFELESSQIIHQVGITTKKNVKVNFNPQGAEIKIGSREPATAGDFSSYKLLGKLSDSLVMDTTYTIENVDGITGRFVFIQRKTITTEVIKICHVFIA